MHSGDDMKDIFRESRPRLILAETRDLDFPAHIHEEPELVYMVRGSCMAYCGTQRYALHEGDFFLACPEQVHHYHESADCLAYLIIVHPKQLGIEPRTPISAVYHCEDADLRTLLELTMRERSDLPVAIPMLRAVFGKLLRHYAFRDNPVQDSTAQQIVRYCSLHYKEPLSVDAVAKALYLSPSHISHTFSEKLKIGFSNYVNSLRLDEAVHLLNKGGLSIEQVAERSGFPTTRTFHRVFREKYGMSPREYVKTTVKA